MTLRLTSGLLYRGFSSSCSLYMPLTNHKLFPKVNWDNIEAGQYAVVDPVNPGTILYLSEQDYIVMVRVAITSNKTLKVLAVPGDTKPVDTSIPSNDSPSQNSPSPKSLRLVLEEFIFGTRQSQGSRGRKRARFFFSSKLLPFAVRVNGTRGFGLLEDGILMVKLTERNLLQWFHTWHDNLSWWSRGSQLATVPRLERNLFGTRILKLFVSHGVNHLIQRFKIMLYVVNAYLGGRKLTSTVDLGFRIRLTNGLPAILPLFVRDGLRHGNRHYIHIWTSVLFCYKGILGSWEEPNLAAGSIVSPHPDLSGSNELSKFRDFCSYLWNLLRITYDIYQPNLKVKTPFFTTKAGPNSPISILGAGLDAYLWWALDKIQPKPNSSILEVVDHDNREADRVAAIKAITGVSRNYIREWLELTGQNDLLLSIRKTVKMFSMSFKLHLGILETNTVYIEGTSKSWRPKWVETVMGHNNPLLRFKNPTLSRLHNLYEAAGKVRTIAIVDYWTNFVLKPLHDWMFRILELLPQDATFDQEGRVEDFSQRGYTHVYSYDLKSATDLIPLALYRALFGLILPEKVLNLWFDLLVSRDFQVPSTVLDKYPEHPRSIRYSTGQPMGALTSWASMALVHHALVLYAAVSSGATALESLLSFRDYLVLGDDIVIANEIVARRYIEICKEFKIPVGLAKSHISEIGLFNFANQTFSSTRNVSPVSMREDLNANNLPTRIEFAMRMARRQWLDMGSHGWLVPFMKRFFDANLWKSNLAILIARREIHPVMRWIVATLLTPGATRLGFTGMSYVNLDTFLAAMLRKGGLWSTRVTDLYKFLVKSRSDPILISILVKWVNQLYKQFLENRKKFLGLEQWIQSVASVELEWLLELIFAEHRKDALQQWTDSYRMPLKEIQVAGHLTAIRTKDLFALGIGRAWADIVGFVAKAEAKLPLVPDFNNQSLEILNPTTGGASATLERVYRQQLLSFMRVSSLLQMVDDLGPTGTPGFVKPGDRPQSSDVQLSTESENKNP